MARIPEGFLPRPHGAATAAALMPVWDGGGPRDAARMRRAGGSRVSKGSARCCAGDHRVRHLANSSRSRLAGSEVAVLGGDQVLEQISHGASDRLFYRRQLVMLNAFRRPRAPLLDGSSMASHSCHVSSSTLAPPKQNRGAGRGRIAGRLWRLVLAGCIPVCFIVEWLIARELRISHEVGRRSCLFLAVLSLTGPRFPSGNITCSHPRALTTADTKRLKPHCPPPHH
ncbi:hypothetical protein IQ06DRAFT_336733 [Phaeosphaeriaceae sp. SRC1lsM3a]|nr:hypothetical protein IQ06DRAFT_336733 [Stagonospora sp. SRC1lsM3a]